MNQILKTALAELGVAEILGPSHNPRIVEYHSATALKASADEVPWCASFVNWVLSQCDEPGTNSAAARSFQTWGNTVQQSQWQPGDLAVFSRGNNPAQGHVGIILTINQAGVWIVGGNQNNRVSVDCYPIARLLSIRRI